jgi:hypothetical protein
VSQLALFAPVTDWYGMWLVGRPSAGGKPPVWQVEHWFVTATCVWLNLVVVQAPVVLWHVAQVFSVTGMWLPGLPVAPEPLWQVAQLVAAVYWLWSTLAPVHTLVDLWQDSQLLVTPLCVVSFGRRWPGVKLPMWHVWHCAATVTLVWNFAGAHAA